MLKYKTLLAGCIATGVSASVFGQAYFEVFDEAEAANGDATLTFLETVTVGPDGTAYAFLRDTTTADVGGITAFDGSGFTNVMTPADWTTFGSTQDYAAGNGVGIASGKARAISSFDNNVYEVDIATGVVSEAVSAATLDVASGVSSNFTAVFETTSDGTIYALESVSDQVLAITPGNVVSVEINTASFAALLGGTSIGGIGVNQDVLYLGSNSSDQLLAWDTTTNTGSVVLTTAQIEAVTDDVDGRAGFGDIFYAPDGLVYFYESDSDYLLSFNPLDAANTLAVVLTEAEFTAGPGSDTINQLSFFDGNIAWTDTGIGYYTIPEPTAAVLLGMTGLAFMRRRRA
ncbi:MAG: hypothetical protein AAGA25_11510 [Planctomycetota bacterium]